MSLVALKVASTTQIWVTMNRQDVDEQTMSEVSSQLTVLRYKGLVEVIDNRKGIPGGSTWQLTKQAQILTANL